MSVRTVLRFTEDGTGVLSDVLGDEMMVDQEVRFDIDVGSATPFVARIGNSIIVVDGGTGLLQLLGQSRVVRLPVKGCRVVGVELAGDVEVFLTNGSCLHVVRVDLREHTCVSTTAFSELGDVEGVTSAAMVRRDEVVTFPGRSVDVTFDIKDTG